MNRWTGGTFRRSPHGSRGHREYKWLSIVQEDMEEIRYRCLISDLQAVEVAGNKWGVSFQVTCDSPYAYLRPMVYDYTVVSSLTTTLRSESSHNGFYYPKLAITGHNGRQSLDPDRKRYGDQLLFIPRSPPPPWGI